MWAAAPSVCDRLDYWRGMRDSMAASEAMLDEIDLQVAVWDGKPARGFGGREHLLRCRHLV
jgi:hypothetical protein